MPTYLVHGFRWQRASIRVFVILRNVEDASPDWIVRPASACSLLDAFQASFGFLPPRATAGSVLVSSLSSASSTSSSTSVPSSASTATSTSILASQAGYPVRLLEEFDPADLETVTTPYAYVADHVVPVDRSVSIVDAMAAYERRPKVATADPWLDRLRDQLQPGEDLRWYVVVNGDEERDWPQDRPSAPVKPTLQREALQWPLVQPPSDGENEHDRENDNDIDDDYNSYTNDSRRHSALRHLRHELGGFGFEEGGLGDGLHQLPVVTAAAAEVRAARAARAPRRTSTRAPKAPKASKASKAPRAQPRVQPRAGLPPPALPPPTMPPPPPPVSLHKRVDTAESGPSRPQSSGGFHRLLRSRSRSDARQLLLLQQQQQQQHQNYPYYQQPLQPPLPSAPPNLPLPPIPTSAQSAVRHKKSTDAGVPRPKTATGRSGGSSGFRRLFGRSSKTEEKAAEA
ncbi:hypothetical protein CMQ_3708 [Grosmannia clavigera kw1407]|uniref:Developmental regulator n=1 Tax=Grosmannia clavigera (strain kw1407 / UAMH 11150) TaxID=655863 RepID=F0XAA2_GROCL|nr:uncharacterized protein CMQ_3708 [Grosmannia clavigera kw1407]EFX05639.1 hypothetical protein CMQ_3708 [Grosmannia clavigera kw1407]